MEFSTIIKHKKFKKTDTVNIQMVNPYVWKHMHCVKSNQYFPAFGLKTEISSVYLHIHFEHRKIRTRYNFVFGHFLHSVSYFSIYSALTKPLTNFLIYHHYLPSIYYLLFIVFYIDKNSTNSH